MGNRRTRNRARAEQATLETLPLEKAVVRLSCDRCGLTFPGEAFYTPGNNAQLDEAHRRASRASAILLAEHLSQTHGQELLDEAGHVPTDLPNLGTSAWNVPYIPPGEPWPTIKNGLGEEVQVGRDDCTPMSARTLMDAFPVNTSFQDNMLSQLERCWAIMLHRSKRYNDAWLNRGANGNVLEILKLSDRIKAQLWDRHHTDGEIVHDDDLDDLRDMVNYALACLTQAELAQWNSRRG
jgi:hypothetical protein